MVNGEWGNNRGIRRYSSYAVGLFDVQAARGNFKIYIWALSLSSGHHDYGLIKRELKVFKCH